MKKYTKIGLSALCGSLASISAVNAGTLDVTGSAAATWTSLGGQVTGNPIGMTTGITFTGNGELDNGNTFKVTITHAAQDAYSTAGITLNTNSSGTFKLSSAEGSGGIGGYDDNMPTAWEEVWGTGITTNANFQKGVGSSTNINWTSPKVVGTKLHIAYAPANDGGTPANKGVSGNASNSFGNGWDVVLDTGTENACPEPVLPMEAEFGTPMWVFGMKTYQFSSSETIVCTYTCDSRWHLGHINIKSKKLSRIDLPYTEYSSINCSEGVAAFKAGSPESSPAVVAFNISTKEHTKISKPSADTMHLDDISIPGVIEFPTDNNLTAHGFFYPPKNRKYEGLDTSKPPLLVKIHGGPTGATGSSLNESIQYWTTRGIAVMDINYGGSTGYGTVYRRRLDRNWGVVDVADCVNGALHLIKQGKVDKDKVAIDGGSAGGFTTLAALAFSNVFKAGASFYGVTDLEALARDTHKFESKYLDRLIAPYPSDIAIWQERSPINNIDKISAPVILFQGLEDKVVPPNQAETMVQALRNRNMQVAYIAYEGEQHGFRKSFNIKRTLEAELFFYSKIFKFELAEDIKPVDIYNEQKS